MPPSIDQVFQTLFGYSPDRPTMRPGQYSCPTNAGYTPIPACDIYYNSNTTFDRQIAGYGEVGYAITDRLKLTLGERVAHTEFSLTHYADGLENYGPGTATASQHRHPNTPEGGAVVPGRSEGSVLLHLRQGLPRGRR